MLSSNGARAVLAHVVEPPARGLLKLGISPDAVTVVGTAGTSAAALIFYPRQQWILGTAVIALFVASDMLDGTMARISGRSSVWGAFLDSTLDRVADGAMFGGVVLGFALAGNAATAAAALALLIGAFVVSYAKARAESLGLDGSGGFAERSERLILGGIALVLYGLGVPYILPAAFWIIAALVWATAVQRIVRARRSA